MKKICFATNNDSKIVEIKLLLQNKIEIVSLKEINCIEDIPEIGTNIEENSFLKAQYVSKKYKIPCFADDSGLIIDALKGEPGVNSSHYSGTRNDEDNINKVLNKLTNIDNRKAKFKTVITWYENESFKQFVGEINGTISLKKIGNGGFGYDSIFIPENFDKTFAEMTTIEKNIISHRAIAIHKLMNFLNN